MSWITTLFLRFQGIWLDKWARCVPSTEILECAKQDWRLALAGLTGEQIKTGIEAARNTCEWPPSIAEFIRLCNPDVHGSSKVWEAGHPGYDSVHGLDKSMPESKAAQEALNAIRKALGLRKGQNGQDSSPGT